MYNKAKMPMKSFIQAYVRDNGAATAIEYGLIAAGISLAIIASVFLFGDSLQQVFNTMPTALSAANAEIESSR